MANLRLACLVDNPDSWIVPYAQLIAPVVHRWEDIPYGDILFILSCENVLPAEYLERNTSNVVAHPSALPKGRGWSPVAWQILEGKNNIPITLIEARCPVDSGEIYLAANMPLVGRELNEEIKRIQGEGTVSLCKAYADAFPMEGREQEGTPTSYPKRGADACWIDPNKTIAEQFNVFRVADNDRYPAFTEINGTKYTLKIYEA